MLAFGPTGHGDLRQVDRPNLALPRSPVNLYVRFMFYSVSDRPSRIAGGGCYISPVMSLTRLGVIPA